MQLINSIAIFCGSKTGNNPSFINQTKILGEQLAKNNISIIYGGGSVGLMGAVANAAIEHNGKVIGIIPKLLVEWEQEHKNITELIVVENMHIRKKMIYEMSDAAIILPGGFGTLDELFEMLTWNTLKIHEKKIFILNVDGFYTHLIQHIQKMQSENFLYDYWNDRIFVCYSTDEIITKIIST